MSAKETTTRAELSSLTETRLDEVIDFAGSKSDLARMLSVNRPTITGWLRRRKISKRYAKRVETHKKLGCHFKAEYLRPDLEW